MRPAPAWLADFQARFGAMLRAPLDRASGTLTATPSSYDPDIVREARDGPRATGVERLAVYNRQYWFRLFDVLQSAYPLTSRLLGLWFFNEYAARFLIHRPPRGWDIDDVAEGFADHFADALSREARADAEALVESARIDAAWHDVFRAPEVPPFRPVPDGRARSEGPGSGSPSGRSLLDSRLVPSPTLRIVTEHRPLLDLRAQIVRDPSVAQVDLPAPWPQARACAIVREGDGTLAQIPLAAREAELFALLREHPVAEALGLLERACTSEERAELPERARGWLARSVRRGFWSGLDG